MSDPLGLFSQTPAKADPLGLFGSEPQNQSGGANEQSDIDEYKKYHADTMNTYNKPIPGWPQVLPDSYEDWKKKRDQRIKDNVAGVPIGLGEQALNLAGGVTGAVAGPLGAGMNWLNDKASGREGHFSEDYNNIMRHYGSLGTQLADLTGNESKSRSDIADIADKATTAMIAHGLSGPSSTKSIAQMKEAAILRAPELSKWPNLQPPEIPKTIAGRTPITEKLKAQQAQDPLNLFNGEQLELPLEVPSQSVAEMQARGTAQPDLFASDQANFNTGRADPMTPDQGQMFPTELQQAQQEAQAKAQAALEARQTQMEQDVARQGGLDRNAAEMARQQQAGTGVHDWAENQRQEANTRLPGDNTPMDMTPAYPVDINDHPNVLADAPYQYEGGIDPMPYRAEQTAAPVTVADMLKTGERSPDPFNRYSPQQAANRILREGEHPPIVKGGMKWGQRGSIEPEVFKDGYRGVTRWLSKLTDKPWVRQSFPASLYETNKDGSPMVLLHGTRNAFNDQPRGVSMEGLHAGYPAAATMKAGERMNSWRIGNTTFGDKSAIYPVAIRKGNYIRLPDDYGSWAPGMLANMKKFIVDFSKVTGTGYYDNLEAFDNWYKDIQRDNTHENGYRSDAEINKEFAKFLKTNYGVDGFWYPNKYESSKNKLRSYSGDMPSPQRARYLSEAMTPNDSLVTYNDNNFRSIYDTPDSSSMSSGIGRDQSGKIDFDSIGKFIASKLDTRTSKERILMSAVGDNSLILRGDKPEDIIAAAKPQPDGVGLLGGKPRVSLQSGLGMYGEKMQSALATGVARWMTYAENMAEKANKDYVKPLEEVVSRISGKQARIDLNDVLRDEQLSKTRYTEDQLRQAGMDDKSIAAYKEMRKQLDDTLTRANDVRKKLGLDPVTEEQAYYSANQQGNWELVGKDAKGDIVDYARVMTRREANKALAHMTKQDNINYKVGFVNNYMGHGIPRDVLGTYQAIADIFKDTPMEQQLHEMMQQAQTETAFNSGKFSNHFLDKKKNPARGFLGDRPWLDPHENALQGLKSQISYIKEANRWIAMQEAMSNIKEVLSDRELQESQPNNMEVAKAYVANFFGGPKNWFRGLETDLAKTVGISPGSFSKYINGLKSMTYAQLIGASPGYMIATPLQALVLGISYHQMLGVKANMLNVARDTLLQSGAILANHEMGNLVGKDFSSYMNTFTRDAMHFMEDNNIISRNMFDENANLGSNKTGNALASAYFGTVTQPEKVARVMTFMSFANHLKESGLSQAEVFRRAGEMTDATLTNFSRNARPLIAGKLGTVGELAYTLKGPMFNYYNSLFTFAHEAQRTGNFKPLATALIMTTILGGVTNLPMTQEYDGMVDMLKSAVANLKPEWHKSVENIPTVKETALKYLPDAMTYGFVSSLTNTQMASRFSTRVADPQRPLDGIAPVAQEIKEQASLANAVINPGKTSLAEGLWQNAPPLVKGQMESRDFLGEFKVPKKRSDGTQGAYNPNDLGNPNDTYQRNDTDWQRRSLGLTSLDEARYKDVRSVTSQEKKRYEQAQESAVTRLANSVIKNHGQGDNYKYIVAYFENHGDENKLQKELQSKLEKANLTPEERNAIYANTLQEALSIKRQIELNRGKYLSK